MPRLRPFKALRYPATRGAVASQRLIDDPSAATEAEKRAWTRQDPVHPVHLLDAPNPEAVLRRWRDDGSLAEDVQAAFHVLEIQPAGDFTRKVRYLLGALAQDDDATPDVERTAPLEDEPRPVPGGCLLPAVAADDHLVLRSLLSEITSRAPAPFETRSDGHVLRLWRVDDPTLHQRVFQTLEDVLIRPLGPAPEGGPRLAAVVPLSDPGLQIRPIHRALKGVPTFHEERFLTLVRDYARIYDLDAKLDTPAGRAEARERMALLSAGNHAVLFVMPGGRGKILRFRQALELTHIKAVPRNPTLRSLDLALLNALVLRTVLGVHEPESPTNASIFPVPSLEQLTDQVNAGLFQAGFGLNPPPVWEIRAVMEARQELPPRTLMLDPAPPAGLLYLAPEG